MPLDPQVQEMLALLDSLNLPPMSHGTAESARAAFRNLTVDARQPGSVAQVGSVEDLHVDGATGPMAARIYRPEGSNPSSGSMPTTVFFHGGGFVIGDIETHDNQCRWICRDAETVVLSVDYRLAPEDAFPAAVDDCLAATHWAAEHRQARRRLAAHRCGR